MYNQVIIVYMDLIENITVCNEWQQVSLSPVSRMTNFMDWAQHTAQHEHMQMWMSICVSI